MSLFDLIRSLVSQTKKIDKSKLPSQGIFYFDDFDIKIKRADIEDIIDYEFNFDKNNLFSVIESIKKVIRKNIILPEKYKFSDIKSVDIVYIFLEIVKFTNRKDIVISHENEISGLIEKVSFGNESFNYFDFGKFERLPKTAELFIDGYKVSMPSIGIENCLTEFLLHKSSIKDGQAWNSYNYDFLFFCSNKNYLSFDEIENLTTIFNFDLDEEEQKKVSKIVKKVMKSVGYTLKLNGRVVDLKSKINLETIWKN